MTAKQLILHIGSPKTGTTTLQDTLLASRTYLRDQGIVMPTGALIQGNAVQLGYEIFDAQSFESERKTWLTENIQKSCFEAKAAWDDLAMKATRDCPDKILISSEHFMRQFSQTSYANAKQHLWHIAQDVKIVAYLRSPAARFLSFQQRLKVTGADLTASRRDVFSAQINGFIENVSPHIAQDVKIVAYLRSPAARFLSFHQQRLKVTGADLTASRRDVFSAQINGFIENVSPHIAVRVYDRSRLFQGDIVADFCRHHLPDIDVGKLTRSSSELNTTMSVEAMAILKDCHNGTLNFNFPMHLLWNMLERIDSIVPNPTKPALCLAAKRSVTNWHAADLIKLRDHHDIVFPDVSYEDLDPDDFDRDLLNYRRIEDICAVDQRRKSKLLRRLRLQTNLPKPLRRWAAKW